MRPADRPGRSGAPTLAAVAAIDLNSDLGESFGVWKLGDDEAMLEVVTQRQRGLRVPRRRPVDAACGVRRGRPQRGRDRRPGVVPGPRSGSAGASSTSTRATCATPCCTNSARSTPSPRSPGPRSPTSSRTARCTTPRSTAPPRPRPSSPRLPSTTRRSRSSARPARRCCGAPTPPASNRWSRRSPTGPTCATAASCRARSRTPSCSIRPRSPPAPCGWPPSTRWSSVDGSVVKVAVRSLCLHGDTPGAVGLARAVRDALDAAGVARPRLHRVNGRCCRTARAAGWSS